MNLAKFMFPRFLSYTAIFIKTSKLFLATALVGILGAILWVTPLGLYLEEEFGLAWLFFMRGEIPSPEEVVIISVDQTSAEILHLPDNPEQWPREYYARLLSQINRQRPSLIALNIVFKDHREPQSDQELAQAITQNNNVILGNYLKHKVIPMSGTSDAVNYESLIESIDMISSAALGSAPFLVPKTASTVKQFWTHKESAGDLETLPDLVFQTYVFKNHYPETMALLEGTDPAIMAGLPKNFSQLASGHNLIENIDRIQKAFIKSNLAPEQLERLITQAHLPIKQQRLLHSWQSLLHNKSLYLNHYGNVGAIKTIPFYQALEHLKPDTLKNKIVLIGYSETIEPEKNLGFYTFFSNADNQPISPIEIVGTAIANLIDNTWLKPLSPPLQLLILLLWGTGLSALRFIFPYRVAISLILLLSGAYLCLAYYEFITTQVWLPLIIPIGLQTPLIAMAISMMHFWQTYQGKHKMQQALRNLLPEAVVDNIHRQPENRMMDTQGILTQGVCMATDIRDYTKLSESLNPTELTEQMNAYYAALFPIVDQHEGYVTDLAGDGMYAVWGNPELCKQTRINACSAALGIKSIVSLFNKSWQQPLITRVGLAYGEISIGHTGAPGRYVYRAIGDPVNTASRIEGLNKHLGTQILAAAAVIDGLDNFYTRDLGYFKLKGKSAPAHVFELMMATHQADEPLRQLTTAFGHALTLFQTQQSANALLAFTAVQRLFPNDGPTQFFINYLAQLSRLPEDFRDQSPSSIIDINLITF